MAFDPGTSAAVKLVVVRAALEGTKLVTFIVPGANHLPRLSRSRRMEIPARGLAPPNGGPGPA